MHSPTAMIVMFYFFEEKKKNSILGLGSLSCKSCTFQNYNFNFIFLVKIIQEILILEKKTMCSLKSYLANLFPF